MVLCFLCARWIWEAKNSKGDYHDYMDSDMFNFWVQKRLIPAFKKKYGRNKKMILVIDNASYHKELNSAYYPKEMSPWSSNKAWNGQVLRKVVCS